MGKTAIVLIVIVAVCGAAVVAIVHLSENNEAIPAGVELHREVDCRVIEQESCRFLLCAAKSGLAGGLALEKIRCDETDENPDTPVEPPDGPTTAGNAAAGRR